MNPETLREDLMKALALDGLCLSSEADAVIRAAADAWEFTLDDAAGMVRQLEADREQLREYGDEIVNLRLRLEAAEKERDAWQLAYYERDIAYNKLVRRLEAQVERNSRLVKAEKAIYAELGALRKRLEAAEKALRNIASVTMRDFEDAPHYWGEKIVNEALAALAGEK